MSSTYDYSLVTSYQRISSESLLAGADRAVVLNLTQSILSTSSYAGVPAVEVEASQVMARDIVGQMSLRY